MFARLAYRVLKRLVSYFNTRNKQITVGDTVYVQDLHVPLEVLHVYPEVPAYLVRDAVHQETASFLVPAYLVQRVYLTVDGRNLAPYPDMTDESLYDFERDMCVPKEHRTFNEQHRPYVDRSYLDHVDQHDQEAA